MKKEKKSKRLVSILIISFMYFKRCNWVSFVRTENICIETNTNTTTNRSSRGAALRSMNLVRPNNLWSKMSCNYRILRSLLGVFFNVSFPLQHEGLRILKETKKNWYQVEWYSIFLFIMLYFAVRQAFHPVVHTVYFGGKRNYCTSGINLPGRLCVVAHKWHLRKQMRAPFYLLCPTQHSTLNSLYRVL